MRGWRGMLPLSVRVSWQEDAPRRSLVIGAVLILGGMLMTACLAVGRMVAVTTRHLVTRGRDICILVLVGVRCTDVIGIGTCAGRRDGDRDRRRRRQRGRRGWRCGLSCRGYSGRGRRGCLR